MKLERAAAGAHNVINVCPMTAQVGRTMFETNGLPQHLVDHCNTMDEVWVPTEFNRKTFAAAGVPEHKLRVVPEGIDDQHFDPDKYEPLVLRDLPQGELITGRPLEDLGGNAAEDDQTVDPYGEGCACSLVRSRLS
jgi:glycosyltransferase involved in cell wall biosynthesis